MAAIGDRKVQETDVELSLASRDVRIEPAISPSRLASRAFMEGFPTKPLQGAHYLEIGCGNGKNIIAQAMACPETKFTGTSSKSPRKILDVTQKVDLPNLDAIDLDLNQPENSLSTYNFIVANDVFSTASTAERMALLLTAKRHLADDGVICIGLDTYPGWHLIENLRDALVFGLPESGRLSEKISYLRRRAVEMVKGIQSGGFPGREQQLPELKRLVRANDAEVFSELLDPTRRPCPIDDFISMAEAANLQVIGDVDPLKSNPVVLPPAQRPKAGEPLDLKTLLPTIDKFANTRHRYALLCHANREKSTQGLRQTLDELFIASELFRVDKRLQGADLLNAPSVAFDGPIRYQTSNQMEIMTLVLLEQNRHFPIRAGRLVGHVTAALRKAAAKDLETSQVGSVVAELCHKLLPTGAIVAHAKESYAKNRVTPQPILSPLALHQAREKESHLASLTPHPVQVDEVARFILVRFDGTQTLEQIFEDVKQAVARQELDIPKVGNTPEARAKAVVLRVLTHAARSGLLVG